MTQGTKAKPAEVTGLFSSATWPQTEFSMPTVTDWVNTQHKIFTAAAEFAQETMTIARKEFETGSGVMVRLMSARSSDEVVACHRDLVALVSSSYFENVKKLGEHMHAQFAEATNGAAASAEDLLKEKKAA